MALHKLIEETDKGIVFISKCETDTKLISLALRIMADVDRKVADIKVNDLKAINDKRWIKDKDHPYLWWCLEDTTHGSPSGDIIFHLTDAVDPYDTEKMKIACIGSYAIGCRWDYTFTEAYDHFYLFMYQFYKNDPHAFYLRWWKPQTTTGRLVFAKPGDKKSKVKFEEDLTGNINYLNPAFGWAEATAQVYDGYRMGYFYYDEAMQYKRPIKPFQCLNEEENGHKLRCKKQCGLCKGLYLGIYDE